MCIRDRIASSRKPSVAVTTRERFLTGVYALVHAQLHHLGEPRRADLTLERTLSAVCPLVHRKVRSPNEAPSARPADVSPRPAVSTDMLRHVAGLAEHLAADRTRKRSRARVSALMVVKLTHGAETLVARAALKRFLTVVDSLMNY